MNTNQAKDLWGTLFAACYKNYREDSYGKLQSREEAWKEFLHILASKPYDADYKKDKDVREAWRVFASMVDLPENWWRRFLRRFSIFDRK